MDTPSGFDLASLRHRDTATVDILHPRTGAFTGMRVEVAGVDSAAYRAAEREQRNRRLQLLQLGNRSALTAEEAEADALELLARCTVSWSGVREGSVEAPCTPDNVRRLYLAYPWLRRQVDEAMADRARFFEESPTSSSASPATNSA